MDWELLVDRPYLYLVKGTYLEVEEFDVFCGIDVGKSSHHAVVFKGYQQKKLMNTKVKQDEAEIRMFLSKVSEYGKALVIVDQPGNMGQLFVTIARDMGIAVASLPTYAMHQALKLYKRDTKTDAVDAYVIADIARKMPHLLTLIDGTEEFILDAKMMVRRSHLATLERSRTYLQIHAIFTEIHPALEAFFRSTQGLLRKKISIGLISKFGGPIGIKKAGKSRVKKWIEAQPYAHSRTKNGYAENLFAALQKQTVIVPGTSDAEKTLKLLANRAIELSKEIDDIETRIKERFSDCPEYKLLITMKGIGPVHASTIICEMGSIDKFPTSSHFASYAGLSPKVKQSGTSINSSSKPRSGNRKLKNAIRQSVLSAMRMPGPEKTYYEKKRAEGKTAKGAILALARRRANIIYAMLRDGTPYDYSLA